jgi:hypothetical protein
MATFGVPAVASAHPRRRFFRPTWAEIDLSALKRNLGRLRAKMPAGRKVMFVVKANAYGHEAILCVRTAQSACAADWQGHSFFDRRNAQPICRASRLSRSRTQNRL